MIKRKPIGCLKLQNLLEYRTGNWPTDATPKLGVSKKGEMLLTLHPTWLSHFYAVCTKELQCFSNETTISTEAEFNFYVIKQAKTFTISIADSLCTNSMLINRILCDDSYVVG